jgi:hypothetical protein
VVLKPFLSGYDRGRGAGESRGRGELFALAKLSGELGHNKHRKFLLSLGGAEFAGQDRRVLGLPRFDKTTTNYLSAITTRLRLIGSGFR